MYRVKSVHRITVDVQHTVLPEALWMLYTGGGADTMRLGDMDTRRW